MIDSTSLEGVCIDAFDNYIAKRGGVSLMGSE